VPQLKILLKEVEQIVERKISLPECKVFPEKLVRRGFGFCSKRLGFDIWNLPYGLANPQIHAVDRTSALVHTMV
jgi:hypothetical protein